ncbi:hypothetical protein [Sphingobacterium detergens]|uniref:hypothetical protein n=1 Tax=Sphingobacterium detergens TaxID=1145106 RepID=UPI003AB05F16
MTTTTITLESNEVKLIRQLLAGHFGQKQHEQAELTKEAEKTRDPFISFYANILADQLIQIDNLSAKFES